MHKLMSTAHTLDPVGGTPCSGLYREVPPKRGAFFPHQKGQQLILSTKKGCKIFRELACKNIPIMLGATKCLDDLLFFWAYHQSTKLL